MSESRPYDELLSDANFRALLNDTARRSIPWEEFLGLPQPVNMSPLETWRLLNEFSNCIAVPINIADLDDNTYWYRRTYEIDNLTHQIACECRPNSRLHRILGATEGRQFLVKTRVEETLAAARLDGLTISQNEAMVLLRLDRSPQNATERLLVNTFRAFDHLPDLLGEPFSRQLFLHLRDLLVDGVDTSELHHQQPALGILLGTNVPADDARSHRLASQQVERIAAYLNRETSDPDDIPVLQAHVAVDAMRFYHPYGALSSQVGRLASRLFALKNGLPVLGLLPLSSAKVDWEMGFITPPTVSFDRDMYIMLRHRSPFDSTSRQTLAAQLTVLALSELELRIDTWERRDEEMREVLNRDPLLNQRQRSILARALRNPDAEFLIRYHQRNHNIHYTTARRDLRELQEKGYLAVEQRGKAFVFLRGPRLNELSARRAPLHEKREP
ncbi:MAG: Fic family protein [Coriobacteriia bacterium]